MKPNIALVAILIIALGQITFAQDALKAGLEKSINALSTNYEKENFAGVIDSISPRFIEMMAKESNADPKEFKAALVEKTTQMMSQIGDYKFTMDSDVEIKKTPADRPYALVPMKLEMNVPGQGKIKAASYVVALLDDEKWYLFQVDEPQRPYFLKSYPDFKDITIPKTQITR